MSEIDDLEDIAEQQKFGVNHPKRRTPKHWHDVLHRAQKRAGREMRSLARQQEKSTERRGVLAKPQNQD